MEAEKRKKSTVAVASANWLALRKKLGKTKHQMSSDEDRASKRRKTEHGTTSSCSPSRSLSTEVAKSKAISRTSEIDAETDLKNGESVASLRKMVFGELQYMEHQKLPGKYLAIDCEMVGVGIEGSESSLARVSLVNFHGAVLLDIFVKQRERVVDYRTQFSGIRQSDMAKAKPFEEVQKQVADLIKDRILVGHAIYNDLKALLLSHPRPLTRDTQYYAGKHKVTRSKRVALRHLVRQELGITIQGGEHSSVTDARATMAIFRIHRKTWEKDVKPPVLPIKSEKRKNGANAEPDDGDGEMSGPEDKAAANAHGGGRKGVSSGLTTVIRRRSKKNAISTILSESQPKDWWKDLASGHSKGSMRLPMKG